MPYAVLHPTKTESQQARLIADTVGLALGSSVPDVADILGVFTAFCRLCVRAGMTSPDQIDHLCSEFLARTVIDTQGAAQ